jgi:hypothetical protein
VKELLEAGADVDKPGRTVYDLAKTDEIKKLLKNEKSYTLIIRQENEVIKSYYHHN